MRARRNILLAVAVGFTTVLAACESGSSANSPTTTSGAPVTTVPVVTSPPTTLAPATTATTTTTTAVAPTEPPTTTTVPPTEPPTTTTTLPPVLVADPPIQPVNQSDGEETKRIQARLLELGFWVSGVDGDYGLTTRQAVMAFQKYVGIEADGSVGPITADFLTQVTERARPTRPVEGDKVEVDKDKQLLFIVYGGQVVWALNASTGSGQYYVEQNQKDPTKYESGRSVTRNGDFDVYRERAEGWWEGDLGKIYRPKYVSGGIAIHGSNSIPNYPASHGCIRVSVPAMDMIWESGLVPKGFPVSVFGNDPEPKGPKPTVPVATTTIPPEVPPPSVAPEPTEAPEAPVETPAPDTTPAPAPDTTPAPEQTPAPAAEAPAGP
jgi:peptidoglycan hydrolase-like protein with peptidoglycan-binding domain